MRGSRSISNAVLAALLAAGTAFFFASAARADGNPVTGFRFAPSPFSRSVHGLAFFEVTLADDFDLDVEIRIYTPAGEPVKTISSPGTPQGVMTPLQWDGTNDRGVPVKPGGYLCKLLATPTAGGENSKYSRTLSIGILP